MKEKSKKILIILGIIICLTIIGICIYLVYNFSINDKNQLNNDVEEQVKKINNDIKEKELEVTDEDNKQNEEIDKEEVSVDTFKVNKSQKIIDILKANDVINYDDQNNIIWKKSNIVLDYSKIGNHTVKINLMINEEDFSKKCKLDINVDDKNYTISDGVDCYIMNRLLEYLEVTSNKIGILLINTIPYDYEYSIPPFILIYNDKKSDFEKITNITTTYKKEWSAPIDRNDKKIYFDDNYIYYYKYDSEKEENNFCDGKTDVTFMKYDGVNTEILEKYNDVYIHQVKC